MTPSYQTFLNLAEADSAVIARLEGEPVRWYVMLKNASHQRVAGAVDRDGWMLLWSDPDAAMDWLREQRPDLAAARARDAD